VGHRFDHALDRVRHARHPLHGVAKWSLIGFQSLVGLFVLFCVINLVLTFAVQRPRDILPRLERELTALNHATRTGGRWTRGPSSMSMARR